MVHRLFKGIVPRTNLKNVSLDLLKNYTTLFAIRHLIDGGIDLRLSTQNSGFMNLPKHLQRMMSDWFITKNNIYINDTHVNKGTVLYYNTKLFIEMNNLLTNGI
jgi:hypothetical protein